MLPITKHVWRLFSILILLVGLCLLGAPAADALIYDVNADFSLVNNPNGVWTYGWATVDNSVLGPLTTYPNHGQVTYQTDFIGWYDPDNRYSYTPTIYKNVGGYYSDGNLAVPAGALILHGGGFIGYDLSVAQFTAPSAGEYFLSASFIGRQYSIDQGHVYIFDNSTIIFDNADSYITTIGDTITYSATLNLLAGEKIAFGVGNDLYLNPDSIELQAEFNTASVPVPPTLLLLGSGLVGLLGWRRFRKS